MGVARAIISFTPPVRLDCPKCTARESGKLSLFMSGKLSLFKLVSVPARTSSAHSIIIMMKDVVLAAAALLALVASAAAQAVTTTTAYKEGLKGSVTGKNDCPAGYAAITSAADCVVAGQALGIKDKDGLVHTTAKTFESAGYPTGCLHDTNVFYPNTLMFNPL